MQFACLKNTLLLFMALTKFSHTACHLMQFACLNSTLNLLVALTKC